MRYRDFNSLDDFSCDVAIVVDFIGQEEYRRALEKVGTNLNSKGFVTPFDNLLFALEFDLLHIERLRTSCSGKFTLIPGRFHAGVDFLIGLGQTIPVLSDKAKAVLLGRIKKGLDEGLWPLQHELRIAGNLSKRGWDIRFHDFEDDGGFDFLAAKAGMAYEVEAKAISAFTGWALKPRNVNNLLVEITQHFVGNESGGIPVVGATVLSHLSSDRKELQRLVSAFSTVARTKTGFALPDAQIRFIGAVPDMASDALLQTTYAHAKKCNRLVLVKSNHPTLILELDSSKPNQIGRKLIQTISETARRQFSGSTPAVIWTHINFIPDEVFLSLGTAQQDARVCLLDAIANATLRSEKRNHLSQLVFSGGAFLDKRNSTARSSYRTVVYDSPICRFGQNVIFEGGRKHPDHKAA